MSRQPAFPFYASDWAHSVSAFTLEERGAYITLLAWSWEHGPVPDPVKRIAAILGVSTGHAGRVWREVSKKWERRDGEGWVNPRLERVRSAHGAFMAKQAANGRLGGRPKQTQAITQSEPTANPNANPGESFPISDLRSPHPLSQERSEGESAREPAVVSGASRNHGLIDGSSQRRHGVHAWCDWEREMCVTLGQHSQLKARLGTPDADARLRAWYPTVIASFHGREIGDPLFTFWDNAFAAWVGTVTSRPASSSGSRTGATVDAAKEYLRDKFDEIRQEDAYAPRALKG